MNRFVAGFAVLASAASLVGCGSNEASVVGRWKGKVAMTKEQQAEPFSNLADAFAAGISLDVKADHTFHMMAVLLPIEGSWAMSGRQVTFTPKSVLGFQNTDGRGTMGARNDQDRNKPFVVQLSPDGKSLEPVGNGADTDRRGDFTFTKVE